MDPITIGLIGSAIFGGLTSLVGAKQASNAAKDAAGVQSAASERAAELGYAASQDALNFIRDEADIARANQAPWLAAGQGAVSKLSHLLGIPGVSAGMGGGTPAPRSAAPMPRLLQPRTDARERTSGAVETGRFAMPRAGGSAAPLATGRMPGNGDVTGTRRVASRRPGSVRLSSTLTTPGAGLWQPPSASSTVQILTPDGEIADIDETDLDRALAAGAQIANVH